MTALCAFTGSAQTTEETERLRREVDELRFKNEALQAGFRNQYTQIELMREEISRLQNERRAQPPSPPKADEVEATPPPSPWSASAALGANLNRGNNNSHRVKAEIKGVRTTELDRLTLAFEAESGENEGTLASEYLEGQVDYRRDIHEKLFWFGLLRGRRDAVADLDYRLTVNPGIGYKLIDLESQKLSFETGPAYVTEKLESQNPTHSFRLRVGEEYHWQITPYAKLFQKAEFLANTQDLEDWIVEAELGIETSVTRRISLRFSVKDIYDHRPAEGRERNDVSLNTAIIYQFQ